MPEMIELKELVDFLIHREESSASLFLRVAKTTRDSSLKDWFEEFYVETMRRRNNLIELKNTDANALTKKVPLASVRNYLVDMQTKEELTDSQALSLTILRADTSIQLYSFMRTFVQSYNAQSLFRLFQEELEAHRVRCSILYDRILEIDSY